MIYWSEKEIYVCIYIYIYIYIERERETNIMNIVDMIDWFAAPFIKL